MTGFCWAEERWLTNEEIMVAAIIRDSHDMQEKIESKEDAKAYLKKNPECCKYDFGMSEVLDSTSTFIVATTYEHKEDEMTSAGVFHAYKAISSCGKIVDSTGHW